MQLSMGAAEDGAKSGEDDEAKGRAATRVQTNQWL